jgi:hypothetical protein
MLCVEIITLYSTNHSKMCGQNAEFLDGQEAGAYSYHCEICALLGCYVASSLPTFGDNVSLPFSRVKKWKKSFYSWISWPLKMGPIGCHETSVKDYHSTLRNIPEEHRSHLHRGGNLESRTVTTVFWSSGCQAVWHDGRRTKFHQFCSPWLKWSQRAVAFEVAVFTFKRLRPTRTVVTFIKSL